MFFDVAPMTAADRARYLDRTRATVAVSWLLVLGGTSLGLMLQLSAFALELVVPAADLPLEEVQGAIGRFLAVMALIGVAGLQMGLRRVVASLQDPPPHRGDT